MDDRKDGMCASNLLEEDGDVDEVVYAEVLGDETEEDDDEEVTSGYKDGLKMLVKNEKKGCCDKYSKGK